MAVEAPPTTVAVSTDRQDLFVRMWAVAALAHVVGNSYQSSLVPTPNPQGVALAVVSAAALAALIRPGRLALAVLAVAVIGSAVVEMPLLGNHWLLAALVSLAYLLSGGRWTGFEPAARLILLVFYGFAERAMRPITELPPADWIVLDIAPGADTLVYDRVDRIDSDVILVEAFTPGG